MGKIDFVPNDYAQHRELGKTNFLYLILFGVLMGAIGVTFSIIKVRQKAVSAELAYVEQRMTGAKQEIAMLETLKQKSNAMMKTMVITAELLEPIPRSIILASLTNNLPAGVSLLEFKLEQKERQVATAAAPRPAPGAKPATGKPAPAAEAPEKVVETLLDLRGIAPSDIEVAGYIARLGGSILMDTVALVESKEYKVEEAKYREFKLRARLRSDITLTKEDIERIRMARERADVTM